MWSQKRIAAGASIGLIVLVTAATVAFAGGLNTNAQEEIQEVEPNNHQDNATAISIGDTVAGNFSGTGDVLRGIDNDWYSFEAQKGDQISITVSSQGGQLLFGTADSDWSEPHSHFDGVVHRANVTEADRLKNTVGSNETRRYEGTINETGTYYIALGEGGESYTFTITSQE